MKSKDKSRIRIGFLSQYSPGDRKASSGTNYKMAEELAKIGELKWIPIRQSWFLKRLNSLVRLINRRQRNRILLGGTCFGARLYGSKIRKEEFEDCDIIAAFFCMPVLANLNIDKPIIYFTDATAPRMIDYYPEFTNLYGFNRRQVVELEKRAMDRAAAIVVSSGWAADSAKGELQQEAGKVHTVEFGANIDEKDIVDTPRPVKDSLKILFLGVDWERKGGDIAVEAVGWLNDNGIRANLHVVGIKKLPEYCNDLPYIFNHGFLNKNVKEDYDKLTALLKRAHLMLLPTLAECSAIAFAEASANGLPVFTHATGGVCNYVIDGKNGYTLPLGSTGEDFGRKILDAVQNGDLPALSKKARNIYQTKLNWQVWGEKVSKIIHDVIK